MTRLFSMALACLAVGTYAQAQNVRQIFRPALISQPSCTSSLGATLTPDQLVVCIRQLAVDVGAAPDSTGETRLRQPAIPQDMPAAQTASTEHTALLQQYAAFVTWRGQVPSIPQDARATATATLEQVSQRLHQALQDHGLEETAPLTGELRAGSALTDTGAFAGVPSSTSTSDAEPLAHITWTTAHAGSLDRLSGGDVAVSGLLGLQPAMTIVKLADGASLDAAYQQALVVGAGVDVNAFRGRTETGAVARAGFVRLGELGTIVEHDGASELALPAGSASKVAPYFEVGGRFKLFDRAMTLVHLTHTELSPRLMTEAVYRHDARFKGIPGVSDSSQNVLVWRLMVEGLDITDKRTAPVENKTFTASFGFEYQKGKADLPYGFSFIIRGDLDLLKALQGGHVDTR